MCVGPGGWELMQDATTRSSSDPECTLGGCNLRLPGPEATLAQGRNALPLC